MGEARYNPIGYHVGTVWPFDSSIVAWGLRRYGFKEEAARIAAGILDAAEFFDGRLPEAFGGYPRELTKYPVQYPTACSPQAWSTGAPLLLLRTMLGLEPTGDHLIVDPALPVGIGRLELLDIPGRWGRMDAFGRGRVDVEKRRPRSRSQLGVIEPREEERPVTGGDEPIDYECERTTMKVIIVGGVAGGASCAARLRRLDESARDPPGGARDPTCPTRTAGCRTTSAA